LIFRHANKRRKSSAYRIHSILTSRPGMSAQVRSAVSTATCRRRPRAMQARSPIDRP